MIPMVTLFVKGAGAVVSPAGSRCHFVPLDKNESCPTADLSNTSHRNGLAYLTGELLNMPLVVSHQSCAG